MLVLYMLSSLSMSRSLAALAACTLLSSTGCLFVDDGPADGENDIGEDDIGDGSGNARGLQCEGEISIEVEAEATVLSRDFEQSITEMLVCGQLSVELVDGIQTGVGKAIINGDSDATPAGWEHRDDGLYTTGSATTEMTGGFYLAADTSFGAKGDLVVDDVFRVDSYLVNPRIVVTQQSLLTGKGELRFDAAGPLVELLGFGAAPQSPVAVDATDALNLAAGLESLEFRSDIHYVDAGETTVIYDVHTRPMPASDLLLGVALEYELDAVTASRGDMTVDVENWLLDFRDGGGLFGAIDFRLDIDVDLRCVSDFTFEGFSGD